VGLLTAASSPLGLLCGGLLLILIIVLVILLGGVARDARRGKIIGGSGKST